MKAGDVVFFKRAKVSIGAPVGETVFVGYGFGIMLGIAPPGSFDPPDVVLAQLVGQAGFLRFDDLTEFIGPEAAKRVVEMYNTKYHRPTKPIVGLSGRPLNAVKAPPIDPSAPKTDGPKPL